VSGLNSTAKCLEDAERRYQELFEAEKSRLAKREQENKEMIQKLHKKLKVIQMPLRYHHYRRLSHVASTITNA